MKQAIAAILGLSALSLLSGCQAKASQIEITQIRVNSVALIGGGRVYFTAYNNSDNNDQIVFWTEQNGSVNCAVNFQLRPQHSVDIEYYCPNFQDNLNYKAQWGWASDNPSVLPYVTQITVN